jgi:hypothetical protein
VEWIWRPRPAAELVANLCESKTDLTPIPSMFVPIRVGSGPALQWMIDLVADLAHFEDRWAVDVLHDILRQTADGAPANGPAVPTKAEAAPR